MPLTRRKFLAQNALLTGSLLLAPHLMAATGQRRRPNIIFVLADDQTPAYLSCYGGRTATPNLDRLAREGVRFTSAHSVTALCNPTRCTILTGLFAGRNAQPVSEAKPGEAAIILQNTRLTPETPCIGEMLGKAGYLTGFIGKWHSNFELKSFGIEKLPPSPQDLDAPDANSILQERQRLLTGLVKKAARFEYASHVIWGNENEKGKVTHNPEWLTDGAIEFMEKAAQDGRPFFLHLADTVPHSPDVCHALEVDPCYTLGGKQAKPSKNHPPRATLIERLKKAGLPVSSQQVGTLMLDDQVGALLAALKRLNLDDNTLIVFAQDNGQLGKGSCYSGGTHSALVMRWPQGIKGGAVIKENVSFIDFVPTFLDMAGIKETPGYQPDGVSLLPAVTRTGKIPRTAVYCEAGVARSVIKGKYRYIAFRPTPSQIAEMQKPESNLALDTWGRDKGGDNHWLMPYKPAFFDPDQLYDREADPMERHNLANDPKFSAVLSDLQSELKKVLDTMPTPFPLEISPFVKTPRYAELVKARRAEAAKGDYWPGYPDLDWESYINLNLKSPEEVDPKHHSGWQPSKS